MDGRHTPVRLEPLWFLPELWVVVHGVDGEVDGRPGLDEVTLNGYVVLSHASESGKIVADSSTTQALA